MGLMFENARRFPYYIVRFKPEKEKIEIVNDIGFPYYIVRFKLEKSQYFSKPKFCFHTT